MTGFQGIINHLRARLDAAGIPFVVGGSFALAARGYLRFTDDIDVMVLVDDAERVGKAFHGSRFHRQDPVIYQDEETGLYVDVILVRDEVQRWAFDTAESVALEGTRGVRVLTPEGCSVMLLREATLGDPARVPQRLRDIEQLALLHALDWPAIASWVRRMRYEDAYEQLRAEGRPSL